MIIKILGSGCPSCKKLEANTKKAIEQLKLDASIDKVEDMKDIMAFGVMSTPALVVDGDVKFTGRVPSPKEIQTYLT